MVSALLLLVAAGQLACVGVLWTRVTRVPRVWLLGVVGVGLAYDSAVIGLGAVLGEGAFLHVLSVPRFVAHAVLTPLLIVWAADRLGARHGTEDGRRDRSVSAARGWWWTAVALTGALLAGGVLTELPHLRLVPREYADTLRYAAEHPAPPVPALVVGIVMLAAGIVLWRKESARTLLIGTVVLIGASAAAVAVPPLGNVGEAALLVRLVAAELHARRESVGVTV
ncbi:hypothetical protein [Nocardia farcinica]|uniref:hypothetical protein n=1 Tax=Nocardia farcinica TaxID=37329 RepID=UPI0024580566|nr:hypothetical protein [Nocardia farcinica]